ncbi:unnamed protein product [Prunus armeniaca]
MHLIGKIYSASSKQHCFIIVATAYFTNWVEAKLVKSTIHRFGIPKSITTDRGTFFISREMLDMVEGLKIKLLQSTPYYAQANGQAESSNKISPSGLPSNIIWRSPGGTIEAEKICMVEHDRGKWVVKSAFGIVKHGGVTLINPVRGITSLNGAWDPEATCLLRHSASAYNTAVARIMPLQLFFCFQEGEKPNETVGARAEMKSLQSVNDRDLLGTNIAPTSLDSSVAAWAEAEWISRDGAFAFLLK